MLLSHSNRHHHCHFFYVYHRFPLSLSLSWYQFPSHLLFFSETPLTFFFFPSLSTLSSQSVYQLSFSPPLISSSNIILLFHFPLLSIVPLPSQLLTHIRTHTHTYLLKCVLTCGYGVSDVELSLPPPKHGETSLNFHLKLTIACRVV